MKSVPDNATNRIPSGSASVVSCFWWFQSHGFFLGCTLLTGGKTQKRQTDVEDLVHPSLWVPTQGLGCLPGDLFLGRAPGLVPSSASWPLGSHAENKQALLAQIYGPKGRAHLHITFVPWALLSPTTPHFLSSLLPSNTYFHILSSFSSCS